MQAFPGIEVVHSFVLTFGRAQCAIPGDLRGVILPRIAVALCT